MPFQRFVETGRVAYVSDGPYKGRLCSIVDVIDQTRILVDGPESGVPRGQVRLNQIHLTKFRIKYPFRASSRVVRKAWKDGQIDQKWKESLWARKLASKARREELTDFDRFKLRKLRQTRNRIRTLEFLKLKNKAAKDKTLYGKKLNKKEKKTKKAGSKPGKK